MSWDAVSRYGFVPDDPAVDNNGSFFHLCADLTAIEATKKPLPCVKFTEGRYYYSAAPNFALNNLDMRGEGQVEFIHTGQGQGFVFDGGGSKFNLMVDGIRFAPSPNGTDTLVLKAIHHSLFRVKAYGAGPPINGVRNKAVALYFCVCTRFDDLTVTPFDGQSLDWPQALYEQCIGLWLDMLPGAGAGPTCDCQFNNPVIEVCAIGTYIQSGVGNLFFGGTIEQCTDTGMNIQDGESNRSWALWFEGNKNYDVVLGAKARGTNLITKHPSALKLQNNATWWAGNSVT